MRALIADDHEVFRTGLRRLLKANLGCVEVFEAGGLPEAVSIAHQIDAFDLVVLDLNMPGVRSPACMMAVRDAAPDAKIVVMSASEVRAHVLDALSAGIDGYLPKSLPAAETAAALRQVLDGRVYMPRLSRREEGQRDEGVDRYVGRNAGASNLTDRQREVLAELMLGKSSKEIGRALDVAEGTVKIHLAAIYRALGVRSRGAAIAKLSTAAL